MSISHARISRAEISDAGLLFLKLVAFAAMVLDHVDWLLLDGALGFHDTLGRVVFPVFAVVLGINLARAPDAALPRVLWRLVIVGVVASVPYVYLQGSVIPLNVLATFAIAAAVALFLRRGQPVFALPVFLVGGAVVDYAWFGVVAVVAAWWMTQRGFGYGRLLVVAVLVVPFNDSWWSLLAVLLGYVALCLDGPAPRLKWLFYVGYPLHLVVLALIRSYL
ncbi:TraX family protein [Luteimonas saliphila]|uniref:TraX family protein n=1 Tax=Luteimonas saliphila TaxID=2804919 RepID=UPI00192DBFB9|nr:TraX family protein [Luteimonas saliphila]